MKKEFEELLRSDEKIAVITNGYDEEDLPVTDSARDKKFSTEEEVQFLEIKSVLIQQLELILATVQSENMTRDDVHNMISTAPSLRALAEFNDGSLRGVESQLHKISIAGQCIIGQLKVKQRETGKGGGFFGFGKT